MLCLGAGIVLTKVCAWRYERHLSGGEGLGGVATLATRLAGWAGLSGGRKQDKQQAGAKVRGSEYTQLEFRRDGGIRFVWRMTDE